jgi:hypothetical protein
MNIQDIASASAIIKQELEPLAQKIGQGAEHTFGLFVRQVYVNAITNLLWIPVGVVFAWISVKLIPKIAKECKDNSLYSLEIVTIPLCLICLLVSLSDLIAVLVNPHYQAIKLIIEMFKSK